MIKYKFILVLVLTFLMGSSRRVQVFQNIKGQFQTHLDLAKSEELQHSEKTSHAHAAYKIADENFNDSTQIVSLYKVANRFWNLNNFTCYKEVTMLALQKSLEGQNMSLIAKGNFYLGDYYKNASQLDSALFYYRKSERLHQELKNYHHLVDISINISEIYFLSNDYYRSELEALDVIKQLRYLPDANYQLFKAYTILGAVYNDGDDFNAALKYFGKALEIQDQNHFREIDNQLAVTYNNIGSAYQRAKLYNLSLRYFKVALHDVGLRKRNPLVYAVILDNIAYSKFKSGINDPIIPELYTESIRIKDSLKNLRYSLFSKARFSEYLLHRKDTINAMAYASDALKLARMRKDQVSLLLPLQQLIASDPKNAANYSAEYIQISDSLQLAERQNRNKFARIEFETDEIVVEKDKAIRAKWQYFGSAIAALSLVSLLFVVYRQKTKQNELQFLKNQEAANQEIYRLLLDQQTKFYEGRQVEKSRIARDLHDGVMNKLTSARLNLFPLTQKNDPDTLESCVPYISGLKEVEEEIRNISHDLNKDILGGGNGFELLIQNLFDQQKSISPAIFHLQMDSKIDWENIPDAFKVNLYRILQESFQNINKHAEANNIFVNFEKSDTMLLVEIIDDGIGYKTRKVKVGIGLKNIKSRVATMHGTVDFQSERGKGVKIKLAFPL